MPSPPRSIRPVATRRAAVAATLLAGLAAAGCTGGSPAPVGSSRGPGTDGEATGTAGPGTAAEQEDLQALQDARAALSARLDLVRRTARRHRGLGADLDRVASVHQAHERVLAASTIRPRPPRTRVEVPASRRRALELLLAQESTLQRRLGELSQGATSGAVARLLASMAAAVGQQVALLPDPGRDGDAP